MPTTLTKLQQMGQTYAVLTNGHGGRLIILEKGARALDLKADEDEPSAFWHNLTALRDDKNWNCGGDRTWLSPELDYFQDSSGTYRVPEQLDPGSWKLTQVSQSHAVANMTCDLQHSGSSKKMRIDLDKRYTLVPNPFLMNHSSLFPDCSSVSYVGFEVCTEMNLTPLHSVPLTELVESPPGYCNLWSIAQVPPEGEILAATHGSVRPITMFSQTEDIPMTLLSNGIRLRCEGPDCFKISLDAMSSTGRFGYLRPLNNKKSSLIIRQFSVSPSCIYPDYPSHQPDYLGSCMQFYYDGGQLGHFAELEYHTPALPIDIPGRSIDVSSFYYFVGDTPSIQKISTALLGIPS